MQNIAGHASIDVLRMTVVFEIFVVGIDSDGDGGPNKEVTSMVETSHQSKEFTVVNVIVAFSIGEGLGVETHSSMFAPRVLLGEYGSRSKGRSIDLEEKWFRRIRL